ncbi:ABC transporter ATP-binding protein [Vulcanimicrobium alpinum]|uniref:ABC transporter ATP-binding protein n=1 Tax=Vulcanimicrobium alpinum TaxID=3016050 RepID=A0AAN1XWC2_UNVUL|nr:ABC transporter ATP-binding protein [Vulcanimicrobium alpinum]BDE05721.1 ABC transporter ATP-binding protein [Vulcanimicrobium alpinum]
MSAPAATAVAAPTRLKVEAINTYYGDSHVLRDVSLHVGAGETVALLGRNGVGKTTTLKSIVGWVKPRTGSVTLDCDELVGRDMMTIARAGIALVPEERRIFTNLTVAENLKIAQVTTRKPGWTLDHVYDKFPRLRERLTHKGDEISGGEKQMLAIARALLQDVKVLLLDEPTEGLAPLIVREVENVIREIKASGITTLLVEQNLYSALSVADRCYIIDQGEVKFEGTPDQIRGDEDLRRRYLHV